MKFLKHFSILAFLIVSILTLSSVAFPENHSASPASSPETTIQINATNQLANTLSYVIPTDDRSSELADIIQQANEAHQNLITTSLNSIQP